MCMHLFFICQECGVAYLSLWQIKEVLSFMSSSTPLYNSLLYCIVIIIKDILDTSTPQ